MPTMYAPPGVLQANSVTNGTVYRTDQNNSIQAIAGDVPALLAQGFTFNSLVPVFSFDANNNPTGLKSPGGAVLPIYKGLKNFKPQNYPNTRKARANQIAASTNFNVLCLGDSTTEGSNGITAAGSVANSWPTQIAKLLTAKGIQAGWQNVMGNHKTDAQSSSIQAADPRVAAFGAGWGLSSGSLGGGANGDGVGGVSFFNNSTINALTFTPTVITDSLDVYFFDINAYDPFQIKGGLGGVTAATPATATIAGSNKIKKATFTTALGSPALNVWTIQKAGAGTTSIIQAVSAYNSLLPEISFLNCGVGSQVTGYLTVTTNFWSTFYQLTGAGAGLTGTPLAIIDMGINDWIAGTTTASITATLTTLLTALYAAGTEVLFVIPVPTNLATASAANQAAVVSAVYAVATAFNCAIVDMTERWVSAASGVALGYYGDAGVHPNTMGYVDKASAISEFFLSL